MDLHLSRAVPSDLAASSLLRPRRRRLELGHPALHSALEILILWDTAVA